MEDNKKQYWQGLEQLSKNPEFEKLAEKEFAEYIPTSSEIASDKDSTSRRDFLKVMGFSVAAASLAACEAPIRKAIPYVNKPVDVDPGVPNYYASTYAIGSDYTSIVVKTREGRPIKINGNKLSSVSLGGTSAQVEASILSLYDKQRYESPVIGGEKATWEQVDKTVIAGLNKTISAGKKIAIVSNSLYSPSSIKVIDDFKAKYGVVDHIVYDASSYSGCLTANEKSFGVKALPSYDFSKAKTIVSFAADFLGTWVNSSLFNRQYANSKRIEGDNVDISRLYAFEANLSLTGANADYRTPIKPSLISAYVANLYNLLAKKAGVATISSAKIEDTSNLVKAANDLWKTKGKSLVVCGVNDEATQIIINAINELLDAYGNTIDLSRPLNTVKGDDAQFTSFVNGLNKGVYGSVIFYDCNPAYDSHLAGQIKKGLSKVDLSVSSSNAKNETSDLVKVVAPNHHFLEEWNDFEPVSGFYSFSQPTIKNIFDTRQIQDSFLKWSGSETEFYTYLQTNWESEFANQTKFSKFSSFWDTLLHDGVLEKSVSSTDLSFSGDVAAAGAHVKSKYNTFETELSVFASSTIGTGAFSNNPWLQELPDPITKSCWENYFTVSIKHAKELGIETSYLKTQKLKIVVDGKEVIAPIVIQPGQAYKSIGIALGYGRTKAGRVADGVGVDVYPVLGDNKSATYSTIKIDSIELIKEEYEVAQTQTHHTYMAREQVVQETNIEGFLSGEEWRHSPVIHTSEGHKEPREVSLWKGHKYPNHHWGMAIDLNTCTGCGSCSIACQVENNIPVVGKQEVLNRREMAWLRIDRYYSSDASENDWQGLENASENPEVVFQPMMCQQCNNAPCETVCPVAATTHSSEGLNQMTYNRCIGTRYCANNCPYKVRRFNWFKYHDNTQFANNTAMNNDLGKMVLNPDVTVRSRGVMEKCSFCVQRIQSGKLEAKKEGRRPVDGEITSACASACPSEAITFGDLNDKDSKLSKLLDITHDENGAKAKNKRAYHVLEDLRVDPNVWYLTKVRNKDTKEA